MFILRTIYTYSPVIDGENQEQEQSYHNTFLGASYTYYNRYDTPKTVSTMIEEHLKIFSDDAMKDRQDSIRGFIVDADSEVHPIYKENDYYVMSSTGETFEHI